MPRETGGGFAETVRTILWAGAIALAIRTVAYEPFNIPSGSMIPTLLVGDYLFVSKFSYGYSKHSLPGSLPLFSGRILFSEPERGDVVVFKKPSDNRTDYIKRIVGLPGDRLQMIGGILHINGQPVQRERLADHSARDPYGNMLRTARFVETLPNGRRHLILEVSDQGPMDNTPVYQVPEGHYFGMGDNRDASADSRFLAEVGYIPRENLIGKAVFMFFSVDGSFWEFWKWGSTIRFGRLFSGIE
ncbi:MAG: signal peptidase I [Magnetospirillum sp. WYHS-4]